MASYEDYVANASQYATNTGTSPYAYQFGDWITGKYADGKHMEAETASNRAYEQENLTQARAWEEYLDSTKYQRTVEDLKAAGLNPWLAVNGGSISASQSGSTTSAGGTTGKAHSSISKQNAGKELNDSILKAASSAAKIIMALAIA